MEKLALTGEKYELFFYTPGVQKQQLGLLSERSYCTPEEAVAALLQGLDAKARVALVPEGPYTFVRAEEGGLVGVR